MITIRAYIPSDAAVFRALNLAWIEPLFEMEASDWGQLDDPETHIINKGGCILLAELDGETVGTVGLAAGHSAGTLELVKMSARADLRGQGIGKALMLAAIEAARDMDARRIWLETNSSLAAALALYRQTGFRELTGDELSATPYDRCNCQMVLEL